MNEIKISHNGTGLSFLSKNLRYGNGSGKVLVPIGTVHILCKRLKLKIFDGIQTYLVSPLYLVPVPLYNLKFLLYRYGI